MGTVLSDNYCVVRYANRKLAECHQRQRIIITWKWPIIVLRYIICMGDNRYSWAIIDVRAEWCAVRRLRIGMKYGNRTCSNTGMNRQRKNVSDPPLLS